MFWLHEHGASTPGSGSGTSSVLVLTSESAGPGTGVVPGPDRGPGEFADNLYSIRIVSNVLYRATFCTFDTHRNRIEL